MAKTIEQLQDEERLCDYCYTTNYGKAKSVQTPNGQRMCEGAYCEEAYEQYLDEEFYEEYADEDE